MEGLHNQIRTTKASPPFFHKPHPRHATHLLQGVHPVLEDIEAVRGLLGALLQLPRQRRLQPPQLLLRPLRLGVCVCVCVVCGVCEKNECTD